MELRGLDEHQVDAITLDFEEELKKHLAVLDAAAMASAEVRESGACLADVGNVEAAATEPPGRELARDARTDDPSATRRPAEEPPQRAESKRRGDQETREPLVRRLEAEE